MGGGDEPTLIDERGRIFGKLNLIDAAVGVAFLLILPMMYGAMHLFRMDPPTISHIEPKRVLVGNINRVRLTGKNLRFLLSARLGDHPVRFLTESPAIAELEVPSDVPVGVYTLRLFDQANTVLMITEAVSVVEPLDARSSLPAPLPPVTKHVTMSAVFELRAALVPHIHAPDTDGQIATLLRCEHPRATVIQQSNGYTDLPCVVRVTLTKEKTDWLYQGKPLVVGSDFQFHGKHVQLSGWIESEVVD